jgi:SAM-dependent methyltransferase
VVSIIVFGCWEALGADGGCREAYALLKILDATSVLIVDKEQEHIRDAKKWYNETRAQYPQLLGGYTIQFAVSDMTAEMDDLDHNHFDLAFCAGVLYYMRENAAEMQAAVNSMARAVRPGGWVIACEDEGLEKHFESAGLIKANELAQAPEYAYCYRKR